MNSRQKMVQQSFLDDEAGILRLLYRSYSEALEGIKAGIEEKYEAIAKLTEEINDLPPNDPKRVVLEGRRMANVYQEQYQESLERQVSGILGDMDAKNYANVTDYLEGCYDNGFLGAMYDIHGQGIPLTLPINQQKAVHAVQTDSKISEGLYRRLGKDTADLKRKITSQVSRSMITGESYGQCAQALERQTEIGFNRAARIARTEGHRIQVTAAMDALYDAREAGADVVKQWDATLDKRTRRSHARCDGEIRELDDTFGNGLMCPGDPKGPASEVVNCRCALLQRARWGLDDDELATLKERAAYFGLDKAVGFEEFKEKYMAIGTVAYESRLLFDDVIKSGESSTKLSDAYRTKRNLEEELNKIADNARKNSVDVKSMRSEWDAKKAEYDKVNARLGTLENMQANSVRTIVSMIRKLGPEKGKTSSDYFGTSGSKVIDKIVTEALDFIPTDWIKTLQSSGVSVKSTRKNRSFFDPDDNTLHLNKREDKLTAVHELMHAMDHNDKAFFDDSKDFFKKATAGKRLERLSKLTGDNRYRDREVAYDMGGKCVSPYAYKEYRNPSTGDLYAFEVASMGVEYLYRNPLAFRNDPEMLEFVLNKIKGA